MSKAAVANGNFAGPHYRPDVLPDPIPARGGTARTAFDAAGHFLLIDFAHKDGQHFDRSDKRTVGNLFRPIPGGQYREHCKMVLRRVGHRDVR